MRIPASYYQQFDADYTRTVPAEGYGGWKRREIEVDLDHTALAIMHASYPPPREDVPGWYRAVEYIPRSQEILRTVFPDLLGAVRKRGLPVIHISNRLSYYREHVAYKNALACSSKMPGSRADGRSQIHAPETDDLRRFREEAVFPGSENLPDIRKGKASLERFPESCTPLDNEYIVESSEVMGDVLGYHSVSHVIYAGFAVNWCMWMSPGGMIDMSRRGLICSVIREAVTAVENAESAASEEHKRYALWHIAVAFGFVFSIDDLLPALNGDGAHRSSTPIR